MPTSKKIQGAFDTPRSSQKARAREWEDVLGFSNDVRKVYVGDQYGRISESGEYQAGICAIHIQLVRILGEIIAGTAKEIYLSPMHSSKKKAGRRGIFSRDIKWTRQTP